MYAAYCKFKEKCGSRVGSGTKQKKRDGSRRSRICGNMLSRIKKNLHPVSKKFFLTLFYFAC